MKTVVVYNSQTGFTKRYAGWIAEAAGADCLPLSEAKKKDLTTYEAIVYGSWVCAGRIKKLDWMKKNIDTWAGKKLIVFCTGAGPIESPLIEAALKQVNSEPKMQQVKAFYCPGGLNYDNMSASSRFMMKMLLKALTAKKNKTQDDEEMIKMISSSYDIADKKYTEPILTCLRG